MPALESPAAAHDSIHVHDPALSNFFFWKNSEKVVRDCDRKIAEGSKNFQPAPRAGRTQDPETLRGGRGP